MLTGLSTDLGNSHKVQIKVQWFQTGSIQVGFIFGFLFCLFLKTTCPKTTLFMLIIFVYATILFVYYILLKYHIPINNSHQNSSKSCVGLVLLGSPLSRMQLYNEGSGAGSNLESPTSQAGKGRRTAEV